MRGCERGQHGQAQLGDLVADRLPAEDQAVQPGAGTAVAMTGGRIRQAWTAMLTSPHPAASVMQAGAWPPGPAPPHRAGAADLKTTEAAA